VRLLIDGQQKEIDPKAIYTVVSIDYLMNRRSTKPSATEGDYSILRAAKTIKPIGLTIRDAIIDYVISETAAGRGNASQSRWPFLFSTNQVRKRRNNRNDYQAQIPASFNRRRSRACFATVAGAVVFKPRVVDHFVAIA